MHFRAASAFLALAGIALSTSPASAQEDPLSSLTPKAYYDAVKSNHNLYDYGQYKGEGWAFHAQYDMPYFNQAYQATGDTGWLDYGRKYNNYVLDQRHAGADGYKGWIGGSGEVGDKYHGTHMGDAILYSNMLKFSEIVKNDSSLESEYGQAADRYIQQAQKNMFEKWDSRGTYRQDGPYGAYIYPERYMNKDLDQWIEDPRMDDAAVTQQFNKQNELGISALRLYRATGKEKYRKRAQQIFRFAKSRMQHHDGSYVWNFREPFVEKDFELPPDAKPYEQVRTWIDLHPYNSGYQETEVRQIVEAYNSGIVFDQTDIERLLETQLEVMWNGDEQNPTFGGPDAEIQAKSTAAGEIWPSLAQFDSQMRELVDFGQYGSEKIKRAFFDQVVEAQPANFDRRYVDDPDQISVFDFPHGNTRTLNAAMVINSVINPNDEERDPTILAVRSLRDGEVDIDLYDEDGEIKLADIADHEIDGNPGGKAGLDIFEWDLTDKAGNSIDPGDYQVRWTFDAEATDEQGYRAFPITISVPEPTSLAIFALASTSVLLRRRRGNR